MTAVPRLVVSAPSSGHGKTAIAVGLLAAFAGSGLRAAGFKVGPDHTDAAYLGLAAGRPGRNLDPRLVGAHRIAPLFAHGAAGADVAVVEGTMGLFDSLAGRSEADSTAGVAGLLRAPVVLVVDVAATGQSVAALVHGFRAYDEVLWLGGVILNRVASDRHEQLLQEALDEIGVPVFGALRRGELAVNGASGLPSRGHGVVPVLHRTVEATRSVRRLGEAITNAVDLDGLLSLARSAPRLSAEAWSPEDATGPAGRGGRRPVVALAGLPGAIYGYAETAELLAAAGANVAAVDPLRDETLPTGTDALVVCGGLPEAYAEELSANDRLRSEVAELAYAGHPVIAEGTGLLWLAKEFDGRPMCGIFDASGVTTDRMVVGYREATARATSPVAESGTRVVGYKHHRGAVSPRAGQTPAWAWSGGSPEGFVWRRVHASQLTLHWAGSPEIAHRLVRAAAESSGGGHGHDEAYDRRDDHGHPAGYDRVPADPAPAAGPTRSAPGEPARPEPAYPEPARPESVRREPARPEPVRPEPVRREPARQEPARREPARREPARREPAHPEPVRSGAVADEARATTLEGPTEVNPVPASPHAAPGSPSAAPQAGWANELASPVRVEYVDVPAGGAQPAHHPDDPGYAGPPPAGIPRQGGPGPASQEDPR